MKQTTLPAEHSYPSKIRSYSQRSYLQPIQSQIGDPIGQIDSKFQGRQTQKTIIMRGNSWLKQQDFEQNHRLQQYPLCRPLSSSQKEQQMLLKSFDSQYNKKNHTNHKNTNLQPLIPKQNNMESAFETPKFSFGNRPAYSSNFASHSNSPTRDSQSPRDKPDYFDDIHFSFGKNILVNETFYGSSKPKRNNDFTDMLDGKYNSSKIIIEQSQEKTNNNNNNSCLSQTPQFMTENNSKPMLILREKPFIKHRVFKHHAILLKTIKQQYQQQQQLQIPSKPPAYNFYNFLDKENILLPLNSHQNLQHKAFPKKQQLQQQQQHNKIPGFGRQGLICQIQKYNTHNNNNCDSQSTAVNSRQRTAQSLSFDGCCEDEIELNSLQPSPLNLTFDSAEEKSKQSRGIYIKTIRTNTVSKQPKNIQILNPRIATIL